jgi:hypothetical protein
MKLVTNTWGWTPRGIWWWLRWGWAWGYQTWGIVAHDWQTEERRAKVGPFCWSLGHIPYVETRPYHVPERGP